jgi:hypothetical protein
VLGVVRDLRSPRSLADPADAADYKEHLLAEFVLARLARPEPALARQMGRRYCPRMNDQPILTRGEFAKLTPLSLPQVVPPPQRRWSDTEWAVIRRGHRSRDMDDKWHAFVEADRLFLHRSWTGNGIFEAQFARHGDGWSITELLVCGDRSHYRRTSDAHDTLLVEALVDYVLLGNHDTDALTRLRSMPET